MILRRHALLTALFSLFLAHRVSAQNTEDQNAFDFSLPGARSRGIGGAFVATADDATAAYSNPAGLTLLFRPEVSARAGYWQFTNRTLNKGHGYGPATGIGVDTINGFVDTDFHSSVAGLSFLSFVFPHDRWAIGVFRHQLAQYQMDRQIEGAFYDCQGGYREEPVTQSKPPFCNQHAKTDGVDREFPKLQSYKLDIHSVGAAFAYKLSDKISAGIAVQNFGFSIDATNKVFTARDAQKYQPPNYADPENLEVTATQTGDDRAWAVERWNPVGSDAAMGGGRVISSGTHVRVLNQNRPGPARRRNDGLGAGRQSVSCSRHVQRRAAASADRFLATELRVRSNQLSSADRGLQEYVAVCRQSRN